MLLRQEAVKGRQFPAVFRAHCLADRLHVEASMLITISMGQGNIREMPKFRISSAAVANSLPESAAACNSHITGFGSHAGLKERI